MPNTPTIPNFPPQGIQAQLDLLYLYNPDAANKLIAQLEAGIIEIKQLQEEVEKALQDLQGVMRYKGSVQTEADLPTEGNVVGDIWNIISTDENVAWTGTEWDKFGAGIDTSEFLTKTDAAATYIPQANINTNTQYQNGSTYVPSSSAFHAFLRAPTYYNSDTLLPTATNPAIVIEGAQSYSDNLQDCIIVISDYSSYNTSGKACGVRITTLGYDDRGGTANQPYVRNAQLLFNTLGEDLVFYGTIGTSGKLVITPRSGVWQKTKYSVRILRLTTNTSGGNMHPLNVYMGKSTNYTTFEITPQMPADEAWTKDNFINSDAATYALAPLQDAFNYSAARLYKISNEDKMPTKNTFTLFSLGWSSNDTNNMPTLLASDLQTGKFYFYHGNYENCSPTTWQEFTFGGDALAQEVETNKNDLADLGDQVSGIEAKIPENASATNQLATKADIPTAGLSAVAHDTTLTGVGTDTDPLKVADPIPSGGTAGQVLTKTADGSEWADAAGGSGLPDQTGHTGFLQTDGANATWSDKEPFVNKGDHDNIAIGSNAAIAKGFASQIAIGNYASVTKAFGLAIGNRATVTATGAIQIANGSAASPYAPTNNEAYTFKVALGAQPQNYKVLNSDGTIPAERLAASGTTGQVLSKTDTGMQWVDMGGGSGDYLPLTGGNVVGNVSVDGVLSVVGSVVGSTKVSYNISVGSLYKGLQIGDGFNGIAYYNNIVNPERSGFFPINSGLNLGRPGNVWGIVYAGMLNNGGNIDVPTTGGTMVVATPPTEEGTYTLKATVAADGTVTTAWVKDA